MRAREGERKGESERDGGTARRKRDGDKGNWSKFENEREGWR